MTGTGQTRTSDLPEPTTEAGRQGLAALLADPGHALAALDYDGTLSHIAQRPEDATPADGALEAVGLLARRVGNVVLISGRPAGQLLELSGLRQSPAGESLTVLGQYGLQRWNGHSDQLTSPAALPGVEGARRALAELRKEASTPAGVSVEDKGQALVVHTRLTSDPEGTLRLLDERLRAIAQTAGLEPHPARHALELRPPGFDKGGALKGFVAERSARSVLFIGDDIGDLPAFDALAELRSQGIPGLGLVSDSPEVTGLRERADLILDGPDGVIRFLQALTDRLG